MANIFHSPNFTGLFNKFSTEEEEEKLSLGKVMMTHFRRNV
jgi:hypothetical protein